MIAKGAVKTQRWGRIAKVGSKRKEDRIAKNRHIKNRWGQNAKEPFEKMVYSFDLGTDGSKKRKR